ncbi:MAG: nucleotidyltransferase family protein [Bacteroidaceae bacterium]|nr:nucleotidyltransferase family protein [Bacteroidaceae bacterium]
MKAMIFAAGIGSRLRPITNKIPKALVPVGGVPMLQRTLIRLKEAGFDDVTINIHHFGQQIIDFLHENNNFGMVIHISDERNELLDTGGGILKAKQFLMGDEPFLVHNVDILSNIDLKQVYHTHVMSGADATLLLSDRNTSRKLLFDKEMRLYGWLNHTTGEVKPEGFEVNPLLYRELAFEGIHVISPALFNKMGEGTAWQGKFSIIPFYLSVCQQLKLQGYELKDITWFDIGKPETLKKANDYFSKDNNN